MKNNLIKFYNSVNDWNTVAGNSFKNDSLIINYINLVDEESNETIDGLKAKDQVEFVDGVIDSLVVGSYLFALKKKSTSYELISNEKLNLNISELVSEIYKLKERYRNSDGDLSIDFIDDVDYFLVLVENLYIILSEFVDVEGAFEEVLRSNWSKFVPYHEVDTNYEVEYITSQGRYSGVTSNLSTTSTGKEYAVFRDENGKILKPSAFKEPSLSKYIKSDFL